MKYLVVLFILLFTFSVASAGSQWEGTYDQVWDITVTDCKGVTKIYQDCLIVNDGLFVITFMPNQGRMP